MSFASRPLTPSEQYQRTEEAKRAQEKTSRQTSARKPTWTRTEKWLESRTYVHEDKKEASRSDHPLTHSVMGGFRKSGVLAVPDRVRFCQRQYVDPKALGNGDVLDDTSFESNYAMDLFTARSHLHGPLDTVLEDPVCGLESKDMKIDTGPALLNYLLEYLGNSFKMCGDLDYDWPETFGPKEKMVAIQRDCQIIQEATRTSLPSASTEHGEDKTKQDSKCFQNTEEEGLCAMDIYISSSFKVHWVMPNLRVSREDCQRLREKWIIRLIERVGYRQPPLAAWDLVVDGNIYAAERSSLRMMGSAQTKKCPLCSLSGQKKKKNDKQKAKEKQQIDDAMTTVCPECNGSGSITTSSVYLPMLHLTHKGQVQPSVVFDMRSAFYPQFLFGDQIEYVLERFPINTTLMVEESKKVFANKERARCVLNDYLKGERRKAWKAALFNTSPGTPERDTAEVKFVKTLTDVERFQMTVGEYFHKGKFDPQRRAAAEDTQRLREAWRESLDSRVLAAHRQCRIAQWVHRASVYVSSSDPMPVTKLHFDSSVPFPAKVSASELQTAYDTFQLKRKEVGSLKAYEKWIERMYMGEREKELVKRYSSKIPLPANMPVLVLLQQWFLQGHFRPMSKSFYDSVYISNAVMGSYVTSTQTVMSGDDLTTTGTKKRKPNTHAILKESKEFTLFLRKNDASKICFYRRDEGNDTEEETKRLTSQNQPTEHRENQIYFTVRRPTGQTLYRVYPRCWDCQQKGLIPKEHKNQVSVALPALISDALLKSSQGPAKKAMEQLFSGVVPTLPTPLPLALTSSTSTSSSSSSSSSFSRDRVNEFKSLKEDEFSFEGEVALDSKTVRSSASASSSSSSSSSASSSANGFSSRTTSSGSNDANKKQRKTPSSRFEGDDFARLMKEANECLF